MRFWDVIRLRWRTLTRREPVESELDSEMRFHLEKLIESKQQEGLSPSEARRAAMLEFGSLDPLKEECRDARGVHWLENFVQDLQFGWRMLRRNPGFTTVTLLSLALGIGGATAVFSVSESILLRELPVRNPDQLITLDGRIQQMDSGIAYTDFVQLRRTAARTVQAAYASSGRYRIRITTGGRAIDQVPAANVSHDFFDVLGVRPALGRFFAPADDAVPGSARTAGSVAVISHDLWMREFGGSTGVEGATVLVNQSSCRIIGVAPEGFHGDAVGETVDVWVPLVAFADKEKLDAVSGGYYAQYMGRLRDGATAPQASAEWTSAYQQMQSTRPKKVFFSRRQDSAGWQRVVAEPHDYRVVAEPGGLGFDVLRSRFRQPLLLMLGGTMLVFLIGCANVANLVLSRGLTRQQEMGVRAALGAARSRIVMQILTECLLLSVLAVVLGFALGRAGSFLLLTLVDPTSGFDIPVFGWRMAGFLAAMAVGGVLLFGLWPAVRQSGFSVTSRRALGGAQRGTRMLVVTQVALSVLLLACAALMARSVRNMRNQDFGFQPEQTFALSYWLNARESTPERGRQVADRLLEQARRLPGVQYASVSTTGFFSGRDMFQTFALPGYEQGNGAGARVDFVSPDYFDAMGVPLISGRKFRDNEDTASAMVNEAFVQKLLQGHEPIGFEFKRSTETVRIVGVVRNARYRSARIDYEPSVFFPHTRSTRGASRLEVRTSSAGNPAAMIAALRAAAQEADRDVVVESIRPIREDIDRSFQRELMLAKLAGAFSALALLLACAGLYGTMSYAISRRHSEFGLRMALGAKPSAVLGLVLRDGGILLAAGILIGAPAAWAVSRLLEGFLFGVQSDDASTYVTVALALAVTGGLAAYVPARRAASVDPASALRCE